MRMKLVCIEFKSIKHLQSYIAAHDIREEDKPDVKPIHPTGYLLCYYILEVKDETSSNIQK